MAPTPSQEPRTQEEEQEDARLQRLADLEFDEYRATQYWGG